MKTLLLLPLCLAFFALCLGGTFDVTSPGPTEADSSHYVLEFAYVPDISELELNPDYENITADYYLHIEYDANIISPISIIVNQVSDQPVITGVTSPIGPYSTNDNTFVQDVDDIPVGTITPIIAAPDMVVEILPPINAVQGIQITIIVTIENRGDRRPVDPSVDFMIPGDLVDLLGATANRPDVDINITLANGDFYFHITWLGGSMDGAASDVDITIDLFVHDDACAEFAALNARRSFDVRQGGSTNSSTNSTGNSTSSSSLDCPDPGYVDNGDIDPRCRPQPHCPDDIESLLPLGACGGFCVQGVVYPNYLTWVPPQRGRSIVRRNFVDKLTDDPNVAGTEDPTLVFFFAFLPGSSSVDGGDESTSLDLVIILLPLFLGLLLILCVSILIAALLAALWWFLTGREKMRTRVQWIPGRNKGGEDEGL